MNWCSKIWFFTSGYYSYAQNFGENATFFMFKCLGLVSIMMGFSLPKFRNLISFVSSNVGIKIWFSPLRVLFIRIWIVGGSFSFLARIVNSCSNKNVCEVYEQRTHFHSMSSIMGNCVWLNMRSQCWLNMWNCELVLTCGWNSLCEVCGTRETRDRTWRIGEFGLLTKKAYLR